VHVILITVYPVYGNEKKEEIKFWWFLQGIGQGDYEDEIFYKTWEEALEVGLLTALKLIIKNEK